MNIWINKQKYRVSSEFWVSVLSRAGTYFEKIGFDISEKPDLSENWVQIRTLNLIQMRTLKRIQIQTLKRIQIKTWNRIRPERCTATRYPSLFLSIFLLSYLNLLNINGYKCQIHFGSEPFQISEPDPIEYHGPTIIGSETSGVLVNVLWGCRHLNSKVRKAHASFA